MCEQVEDLLACHHPDVEMIDVASTPEHEARYGLRVPVLEVDGESVLEGRIDEASLVAVLRKPRTNGERVSIAPTGCRGDHGGREPPRGTLPR